MQARAGRRALTLLGTPVLAWTVWILSGAAGPGIEADDRAGGVEIEVRPRAPGAADRISSNIRVDSNLVLVPVTVTNRQDELVTGLDRRQFKLFEDSRERPITQFAAEDAPVSVVLIFDRSGSMATKRHEAGAAVAEFLRTSNPDDEFALVEFAERPRLALHFTSEPAEIEGRLLSTVFKGETALIDAVCLGLHVVKSGRHKRKALVIVSDGGDNHSRYTKREIRDRVREADVQIYALAIVNWFKHWQTTPEELAGPGLLAEFARLSGGRSFEIDDLKQLREAGAKVGSCLRSQYILGFAPADTSRDGRYHRIEVKLQPSVDPLPMRVRFRPGYYAPGP